jgi:hypothetical protein
VTDAERLERLIEWARDYRMTEGEREAQRQSWVKAFTAEEDRKTEARP